MEISINWDLSGFKSENVFEMMAFATNRDGKCKNNTGVICSNKENKDNGIGVKYKLISQFGSNKSTDKCITLDFDFDKIPIYCKEILIYCHSPNAPYQVGKASAFKELEFFNVFENDKIIFSKDLKKFAEPQKVFHIGNLVRHEDSFVFKPYCEFIKHNIIELGKEFDIEFFEAND